MLATAIMAGCGTISPDTIKPPPVRAIDFTIDIQPIIVSKDWTINMFEYLAGNLGPALAQAGVACRVLEPIIVDNPSWEYIADESALRGMMQGHSAAIRVWLVRELVPAVLSETSTSALAAPPAGAAYSPTSSCDGVALAVRAMEDRNTLVHEMGHALGLSHPAEGADNCSLPEVKCRLMSYCFATRNQFSADEIDTIRHWAAVLATQPAAQ
ncbi:MAG TPA: hypothetical protein VMV94_15160 [Phycisphaerae bacterium]|nr:hypothetical protein [Phycisphaerae bacterium]